MFHRGHLEFYGGLNLMKGAIIDSDAVTTVSPTYAREILTPALGQQLDGVLREQGPKLRGILNGLDLDSWDPSTDPALPAAYSAGDLAGKARCRQAGCDSYLAKPFTFVQFQQALAALQTGLAQ